MTERTALVVIDMQNSYFELPGLAEHRDWLLMRVNELVRTAHEGDQPVVLVRTQHEEDRSTWTLNMLEDDQGFAFPGSEQAAFLDGLDVRDHIEIVKTRDSAFFDTDLRSELDRLGVTHMILCGVSTHSCVADTANDAFAVNLHAAVAVESVASENPKLSDALLHFLEVEKRQPLLTQPRALDFLRNGWPDDYEPHPEKVD
ncbi:isochorismatase family cysteine hydrolase [Ammonicoccus fulvus]|uniref:Isochorismatase family cysteine hydrolase n=1 Tax=Ammonicoccus fulvus TaxID=3138240 RepID=A0ABZ3FQP8_9ACTN